MRTVRIWFRKIGTTRFISHLDLTRCMSRAIHRAKIPLWYTQGFNPRALLTFALPLSLGVAGERESVDIKLEDDNLSNEELLERLNAAMPDDLPVFAVTDPVMKPGKIAYASFVMICIRRSGGRTSTTNSSMRFNEAAILLFSGPMAAL